MFWVYGFPILMMVALGIAFRNKPVEIITVDVVDNGARRQRGPTGGAWRPMSGSSPRRMRRKTRLDSDCEPARPTWWSSCRAAVRAAAAGHFDYVYDPTQADKRTGPQRGRRCCCSAPPAARTSPRPTTRLLEEPGGRYIDFLVPGLLGMSLMGGGLWGVGFVMVDMRVRKLLKRFLATPMRKSDFLAAS